MLPVARYWMKPTSLGRKSLGESEYGHERCWNGVFSAENKDSSRFDLD